MLPDIQKVKGIHPGVILRRELKNRKLKNNEFAQSINEHVQTISAILNERRGINPSLSIKLGNQLEVENDYFMQLQACYEVKNIIINDPQLTPDFTKIRPALFWDTVIEKIDWNKNKKVIIKRVFERGNQMEIKEIISFYGIETIKIELKNIQSNYLPSFEQNVSDFESNSNL